MILISDILFRRCSIMFMLCLGISAWVQAEKVDVQKAERVAQCYIESKHRLPTKTDIRLKYTATTRSEQYGRIRRSTPQNEQETAYYYVFDINENAGGGFVIVAGDDIARPVLGYSTGGNFDENNLPPNFECWINILKNEIADAQRQNLPQSEDVRMEWDSYISGMVRYNVDIVGPLLQTIWNQSAPYNNQCPMYADSHTVTGCAATAMAQIMNYHRHPAHGIGRSKVYATRTLNINIPSVYFGVNYDWANMRNAYSGNVTAQQINAVSTLMYHCGVSIEMDYAYSSGAYTFDVPIALTENFGYDKSLLLLRRANYDKTTWENILREQIDTGLPVFYTGYYLSAGEGHAFVCDGYDDRGMFHFNWGWGGLFDGFFVTTALNPGTGGTGSGSGTYNENQEIIIHIKPDPNIPSGGGGNVTCTGTYTFNGGSGTSADPYLIATPEQLAKLAELVNANCPKYNDKYYKLIDDIDLSYYDANWNYGGGWIPIGDSDSPFRGEFDGNNKKITGLYINSDILQQKIGSQYTHYFNGLFGLISEAKIKDLLIERANIKTRDSSVGGIVGHVRHQSSLINCYVSGTVSGSHGGRIGGVVGFVGYNSNITNCYFNGTVSGNSCDIVSCTSGSVGGVVGLLTSDSSVTGCYSAGTVSSYSLSNYGGGFWLITGGVVGEVQYNCSITNCYSISTVYGRGTSNFVGGVVGRGANNSNITNCYSTGLVNGDNMYFSCVGGVVGILINSKITNCYSTGAVSNRGSVLNWLSNGVGGVAGLIEDNSIATNCVALNLSVKGIQNVGRVVGSSESISGILSGMVAFCGITNGGGGAFVNEKSATGRDGENRSAVALQTAAGFPPEFTSLPWTYEEGKLPGLFGETVDMPEHLRSSIGVSAPLDIVLNDEGNVTVFPISFVKDDPDICDKTFVFVFNEADRASLTFTCADIGSHTVLIVAIYEDGSRSQPKEVTFTISDRIPPDFDVISGLDVVVNFDSSITVYPIDFVTYVSDNCSNKDDITILFVVGGVDHTSLTFTCNDIGYHTVSIVAIDGNDNRSQPQEATLMIQCRMIDFKLISGRNITLDDYGKATVYPVEFVENAPNYSDISFLFDVGGDRTNLTFNCDDIGSHTTFIVADDGKGNRSLPQAVTFTISDRTPPVFEVIYNRDINMDNVESITVYPEEFVTNASDNCSNITFRFVVFGVNRASLTFTCADIGLPHAVSIIAIDESGNRSQPKTAIFTIRKQTPPIARCKSVTLYLSGDEKATLTAMMVDNGSEDNCGIVSAQIKRDSDSDDLYANSLDFDSDDLDVPFSVTLRVRDASGNENTCTSSIQIIEEVPELDIIPDIFTPNGDGFNDTWDIPEIKYYPEATIRIYNRAMKLMVELKGAQMPWDGRDRNGNLLESGYYLYRIELKKGAKTISGFVTILR